MACSERHSFQCYFTAMQRNLEDLEGTARRVQYCSKFQKRDSAQSCAGLEWKTSVMNARNIHQVYL